MFVVEGKVIGDDVDILAAQLIDRELDIVDILKGAGAFLDIEDLGIAQRHPDALQLFRQL